MKYSGIYKIQSISNPSRIYIGSSINIYRRWQGHISELKRNIHHSQKLQRHFNKYGEVDLQFSILLGCDKDDLINIEQYFVDSYKPYFNNLYHVKPVKYIKHSDETKAKMRQNRLGRKLSEETKRKISETHKGIKPTEETRQKLIKSHLGKKYIHTPEWNENIGKAQRGRKLTEEHKKKLSEAKKGYIPWNKGRKKELSDICLN